MVRPGEATNKVVHFEEYDNHSLQPEASILSGVYNVEEMGSQHPPQTIDTATNELWCDMKTNPSQLYLRIQYRLWDMAMTSLMTTPKEATIWISTDDDRVLPIHVVCQSTNCPPNILEGLIKSSKDTLHCTTRKEGALPLHLLCANDHFLSQHENLVWQVANAFPGAQHIANRHGQTPKQVLENHASVSCVPLNCRRLLKKFEKLLDDTTSSTDVSSPLNHEEHQSKQKSMAPTLSSFPDNDACGDGIASQLNKMALMAQGEEDATLISYRPLTSLDSMVSIRQAKPIRDDDEREYYSPSLVRESDGGVQFREDHTLMDESSASEDDDVGVDDKRDQKTRSGTKHERILCKTRKENALLRQKISTLTQSLVSLQSNHGNQSKRIHHLQQAIENERELSKSQVKEYELAMARMHDDLVSTQRQLQSKAWNEQKLAQQIGHLESSVAGKKADLSTLKLAIQNAESSKESMEDELECLQLENQRLRRDMDGHINDKERLMMKLDEMSKEMESLREVSNCNNTLLKEQQAELQQKDIQCRSLTESLGTIEKKAEKLDKLQIALKGKTKDLQDALKANTGTYKGIIANLELALKKKEYEEAERLSHIEDLKSQLHGKDTRINDLESGRAILEQSCVELQKRETTAQEVANQLAVVTVDRDQIIAKLELKAQEIQSLQGEIRGLQVESAQKTGTIDETERRIQALYTELVAQRHRETELIEKNKQMSRELESKELQEENRGIQLRVLKTAVESYKREMERFAIEKTADDRMAAENSIRIQDLERRLTIETEKSVGLESRLKEAGQRENQAVEALQQQKVLADEASSAHRIVTDELDQVRTRLQEETSSRQRLSGVLAKFEDDYRDAQRKLVAFEKDYNQLQGLCTQKICTEEQLRTECTKVRNLNRLQTSIIKDLEMKIAEMKTKHEEMYEEHNQASRIAEKRAAFTSKSQESDAKAINELQEEVRRLRKKISALQEEAILSDEIIVELTRSNEEIQEANNVFLLSLQATAVTDSVETLTFINCENLLHIRLICERQELNNESWRTEREALNLQISDLNVQLSNARRSFEDLCDELEESVIAAVETRGPQRESRPNDQNVNSESFTKARVLRNPFRSNDDTITELKSKMRKQFESSRDKERLHVKCLQEYETRIGSLEEEVRKQIDLHSKDAEAYNAKTMDFKATISTLEREASDYMEKISDLELTISDLRSTIVELNDRITNETNKSNSLHEERRLLKISLDDLTEQLLEARNKCRQIPEWAEELQTCRTRDELNAMTILSLERCLADVKKDADIMRKETKRCQDRIKALERTATSTRSSLEQSQREMETLQKETIATDLAHKESEHVILAKLSHAEESLAIAKKELEELRAERVRSDDLIKNYQVEVARLLELNFSLNEECQQKRIKLNQQIDRTEQLLKCKNDSEKQLVENSNRLLDILSKFSPDHVVADLITEKEQLQRDHDKVSEDNAANSANVKYLMANTQLLECHVMDLTSTHKLLLEETERLRENISELEKQNAHLTTEVERQRADIVEKTDLNTTYQSKVDQLLKLNDALSEECQHVRSKLHEQMDDLEQLSLYKQVTGDQFIMNSEKLEDMVRTLSPDLVNADLTEITEQDADIAAHGKRTMANLQFLERHLTEYTLSHELLVKESEKLRLTTVELDEKVSQLTRTLSDTKRQLDEQQAMCREGGDLNKSYEIEVERLLNLNQLLCEECCEVRSQLDKQTDRAEQLSQYKQDSEKQWSENSNKLLNIWSKVSIGHRVSELMEKDKESLDHDHETPLQEDAAIGSNAQVMMTTLEQLEEYVAGQTSRNAFLLEEIERLRQTVSDQDEKIAQLADLSDRLVAFNEVGTELEKYSTFVGNANSMEWDNQLLRVVNTFDGTASDNDLIVTSKAMSAADRTMLREQLRERVTQAFAKRSKDIQTLKRQLDCSEKKAQEYEQSLNALTLSNHTLKLENKILKTAGKEREERSRSAHAALRGENEKLKQSIAQLTQQTAEHQDRIRKLAAKQALWEKRKEAIQQQQQQEHYSQNDGGKNHAFLMGARAMEPLKLVLPTAPSDDMGSLTLSADSQEVLEDTAASSGMAALASSEGAISSDTSVEVVLIEDGNEL